MSKKFTNNKNIELTFESDFETVSSLEDWNTTYYYGSRTNTFNNEEQYYVDDAFVFNEDGSMSIVAQKLDSPIEAFEGVDQWLLGEQGKDTTFDWTSGMLSGHDKTAFQYGYVEISAQIPAGQGLWPAFWMLPTSGEWPPELDIMEALGNDTTTIHQTVHHKTEDGGHGLEHAAHTGTTDYSQGFHTYGMEWTENKITFFIDGQKTFTTHDEIPQESMYLLANLAVGGFWGGSPDETTPETSTYDIDYIRVYQDRKGLLEGGSADDTLHRANGTISGLAGNDTLSLDGKGDLYGGDGHDNLLGGKQSNILVGGRGNDIIDGGKGRDQITGVEVGAAYAGRGEQDILFGGDGADIFRLGDAAQVYYNDGDLFTQGMEDYAVIADFAKGDKIELHGTADDYILGSNAQGTGIFFLEQGQKELIALIENVELESMANSAFTFV